MMGVARSEPFDLDAASREALQFGALLEWLAGFGVTAPGQARLLETRPEADAALLDLRIAACSEVLSYLGRFGRLLPGGMPDPAPALRLLAIEGATLEATVLRDLAALLDGVSALRRTLSGCEREQYPGLRAAGERLPDLTREVREVLDAIEPDGTLSDRASAELQRIRAARVRVADRLRRQLEGILRDPGSESMIRDDFVTVRNGRYVIPVRTDAPHVVRGIVHASSSSGATRFIEPLESVELNNDLVRLEEQQREEIERILARWSAAFRRRHQEVVAAIVTLAEIDTLQARALFGAATEGVLAAVEAGGPLVFEGVRHPLLDRRLRAAGDRVEPLTLTLDPSDRVLVLSGPNAGGKTVALKTFGLAVLMAQAAIPIPAAAVRLPLYRQLRADIGDHQSILADLSTFTAHVTAVATFLRDARPPALFLFDEIGSGTEPTEGSALAMAILERLRRTGMTVVATTHHAALKAWAFTTEGAVSAAMEFDARELRPTFRVMLGAAGVSAGLDIARRAGLDEAIVDRAREAIDPDTERGERYLERLRERTLELEAEREALAAARGSLEEQRRELDAESVARAEAWRRRVARELEAEVAALRERATQAIAGIEERKERQWLERTAEREISRAGAASRAARERLAPGAADDGLVWARPSEIVEGLEVRVHSLGRTGRVQRVLGERVEVLLGSVPFQVDRSDLGVEPSRTGAPANPVSPRTVPDGASGYRMRDAAPDELKLIGLRVEEALERLDKFLDDAALAELSEVRIVHGHGSGRLRSAVRGFLRGHAQVAEQRAGRPGEGGDGATVVRLR